MARPASCRRRVKAAASGGRSSTTVATPNGRGPAGLGQELQEEGLEVVVGAVDVVDEEHRRTRARVLEGAQERPPDEVVGAEEVVLAERRAAGVGQPDAEELAGVVPLVERLGDV